MSLSNNTITIHLTQRISQNKKLYLNPNFTQYIYTWKTRYIYIYYLLLVWTAYLMHHFLCFLFVWNFLTDVNSLTCNDRRFSISFRAHKHSVDPDSCVNFTCVVYLYLWCWHTIFSVKRSSCMGSKPSFHSLLGRFKISLRH